LNASDYIATRFINQSSSACPANTLVYYVRISQRTTLIGFCNLHG